MSEEKCKDILAEYRKANSTIDMGNMYYVGTTLTELLERKKRELKVEKLRYVELSMVSQQRKREIKSEVQDEVVRSSKLLTTLEIYSRLAGYCGPALKAIKEYKEKQT